MNTDPDSWSSEQMQRAAQLMTALYIHARDLDRAQRCMHTMLSLHGVPSGPVLLSQQPVRSDGKYLFTIT